MTAFLPDKSQSGTLAHIHVFAPAAGTVLNLEWTRLLPPHVVVSNSRVPLAGGAAADLDAFVHAVKNDAPKSVSAKPSAIAVACALATAFRGSARENELLQSLTETAGCPAVGMANSASTALRALGARRVAILTPYDATANAWLRDYIAIAGFEPSKIGTIPGGPAAAGYLEPEDVARAAHILLNSASNADALWIACGNVRTLEIIEELERLTGCAVVSSNLALLWACMRRCGIPGQMNGIGRLGTN